MCYKIIIVILLIITISLLGCENIEKFNIENNKIKVRGGSMLNGSINKNTDIVNTDDPFINKDLYKLSSEEQTNILNEKGLKSQNLLIDDKQKKIDEQQKYLDNKNEIYKQQLMNDNLETTYFYNTYPDQTKITENSYDVINSIDNIDYSKPKELGIEKCKKTCNGTCIEFGYNGIGTCIPVQKTNWGTFYKNPTFTYGLNVPYYNKNNQSI